MTTTRIGSAYETGIKGGKPIIIFFINREEKERRREMKSWDQSFLSEFVFVIFIHDINIVHIYVCQN